MTIVYTKCDICGRWVEESTMDYFTGIGSVCHDCSMNKRAFPEQEEDFK